MIKGLTLIAVTMVIVLFTGCSIWSRATEDESVFNAIILEFNGDSVTVSPVDGGDAVLRSHSQVTIKIPPTKCICGWELSAFSSFFRSPDFRSRKFIIELRAKK